MAFQCRMCGACCSTMGEIISIRERSGRTGFRIGYSTTLETRDVVLDSDKEDLFFGTPQQGSLACPFLRELAPGRRICTVHDSRPDLCRQYSCFRILILDQDGRQAGRVMAGGRYFTATDTRLHEIWQEKCRNLDVPGEEAWERTVETILSAEGYHVIR
ncbi:MAG: YkgJ family cysteine cluster protein [Methanomicrobiales archaeon]|nr:YkgJ family cysteine cluster protein [Methanomicrobiales archaeon]